MNGFDPRNILVIDFGQLGDVVLSLPALRAIRERFPSAKITVAVGKPGADVIDMSGYANATLIVDRVALRDGPKLVSVARIFQFVQKVRRLNFDFVIDLHSLSETNLLGFFSGAPVRLFSRRPGRSLNFLSNFNPAPPPEDPRKHSIDRYLDVVRPLGVNNVSRLPRLNTRPSEDRYVEKLLKKAKADTGAPLVGLFPGSGHLGRRWPLERFASLADHLTRNEGARVIVFAGPEEKDLAAEMRRTFPASALVLDRLTLAQLASVQARLSVFVSNDTGPMHVATAVGTSVVMLSDRPTPNSFVPQEQHHRVVYGTKVGDLSVEEVYSATCEVLASRRTAALFSR